MNEFEKMVAGDWYDAADKKLIKLRVKAHKYCSQYNQLSSGVGGKQKEILNNLLPQISKSTYIEPPFYCDYGVNLVCGDNVYFNFNCTILDSAPVILGDRVKLGPNVQLYTVNHPIDAQARASGVEQAKPIHIGHDVWVGGGSIILAGVTIGQNTVIGAGSVVSKDIPANCVAVGSPCRVIKTINIESEL